MNRDVGAVLVLLCMVAVALAVNSLVQWLTGIHPCTFLAWYWGWCP